jgi:AcrR family transcriptional regulator
MVTLYTCHMAKVDIARRAQIGQEKRARTRAALVAAAKSLFALRSIERVTIDEIVAEAGLAKGTFYTHFEDLDALTAAVADELLAAFDDLMQPARLAIADPLDRIAFGCNAFIEKALEDPAWAQVVTRMARFYPAIGEGTRSRLLEDLRRALKDVAEPAPSLELALEIVVGLMLQALSAFAEKRVSRNDRAPILTALLRALGADGRRIRSTLARLPKPAPMSEAAQPTPRRRGALETSGARNARGRRSAA